VGIQEEIRMANQREVNDKRAGRGQINNANDIISSHFNLSSSLPTYKIEENRWRDIYYPDVLDIKQALQQARPTTIPPTIVGDPTMISERANFRYTYLKGVYEELKLACQTEADRQEAKDLAFLESRRAAQQEEVEVRRRLGGIRVPRGF
jgi:hypothetical protein